MPVLVLDVRNPDWNRVTLAVAMHGLDMTPDVPGEESTRIEITGTIEKLQQVLSASGAGPEIVELVPRKPNGQKRRSRG